MDKEPVLLPCPFCGGEAGFEGALGAGKTYVYCVKCNATMEYGADQTEAAKLWNTRAAMPDVPSDLRAALAGLRSAGRISQEQQIAALHCLAEAGAQALAVIESGS